MERSCCIPEMEKMVDNGGCLPFYIGWSNHGDQLTLGEVANPPCFDKNEVSHPLLLPKIVPWDLYHKSNNGGHCGGFQCCI